MRTLEEIALDIDHRLYHKHNDRLCYGAYQPCGEHHRHDMDCGGRPLICRRKESDTLINELHEVLAAVLAQGG